MNQELPMQGQHEPAAPDADTAVDPVCGMTVDRESARNRGLAVTRDGVEYFFCGRGCKLDFLDDPVKFLAPGYQPHM